MSPHWTAERPMPRSTITARTISVRRSCAHATTARPGPRSTAVFHMDATSASCVPISVRRGLLYAGTDNGVFVSFDDGGHWQALQRNLPVAWVRDLLVHDNDLIAATQGRAIWILDDLSPLRQLDAPVRRRPRDCSRLRRPSVCGLTRTRTRRCLRKRRSARIRQTARSSTTCCPLARDA